MTELQSAYLIIAIMFLGISIMVFPTLWHRAKRDSKKSVDHRIRK